MNEKLIKIAEMFNNYRDGYGQLDHYIAEIGQMFKEDVEKASKKTNENLCNKN